MKFRTLLLVFLLPTYSFADPLNSSIVEEGIAVLMLIAAFLTLNYLINFLVTRAQKSYFFIRKVALIAMAVNVLLGIPVFLLTWGALSPEEYHWKMGAALVVNSLILVIVYSDFSLKADYDPKFKERALCKTIITIVAFLAYHFSENTVFLIVYGVFLYPAIDNVLLFVKHKYLPNVSIQDRTISISIFLVLILTSNILSTYTFDQENRNVLRQPDAYITNKEGFGYREFWIEDKKINFVDEVITDNDYKLNILIDNELQYSLRFKIHYDYYRPKAALVIKRNDSERIDRIYVLCKATKYDSEGVRIRGISGYAYEEAFLIDKNGIRQVNEIK